MGLLRKLERARNAYFGEYIDGIKHYNWHTGGGSWIGDFIRHRFSEQEQKKLSVVSVFGTPRTFWFHRKENKIFFTGENPDRYPNYKNHALPYVKISLGFDYLDEPNYLRFPLWIQYLFKPESDIEAIGKKADEINNYRPNKTDFCSLICKHGGDDNLRGRMFDEISQIAPVMCAGKFNHNDDRLWKEFGNSKFRYLSNFKFTICPENSNRTGYVTEKLFEAFQAGAIPIYWGSDNNPEKGLINPSSVILWNNGGDNREAMEKIRELNESETAYQKFIEQERMTPELIAYVCSRFDELEKRIKALL